MTRDLDQLCINTIRFLSADAVQKANSGHPGMPMGMADAAYVLWTQYLKHNPTNPSWPDRDRFVLSAGHGSILLYSLLHLTGYDLSMEEIKRFRQWGSKTPGHPEYGCAPGVETTTGPLGQGFATGVGMALATRLLSARYNKPGHTVVDHHVYAIVSDGDLMEGVAAEAASLAGHLGLSEIIYLYDDNKISLVGPTSWSFTEDVGARFRAYNWFVQEVDGYDLDAIAEAIRAAQAESERPSLIRVHSHIGYGAPTKQDSAASHGSPLGDQELDGAKAKLGWPLEPRFLVPDEALAHMRAAVKEGQAAEAAWRARFGSYAQAYPELAAEFEQRIQGDLPEGWDADLPAFADASKPLATRRASGQVI
ncbi:MAG: transketolase, partial [Chloroflexi bacterium]|nr:transketolase [Chloroflexota bacterium]